MSKIKFRSFPQNTANYSKTAAQESSAAAGKWEVGKWNGGKVAARRGRGGYTVCSTLVNSHRRTRQCYCEHFSLFSYTNSGATSSSPSSHVSVS